ncbi:hypothetical protein ACJJTC_001338 [Scirpophaga incertulas]
MSVCAQTEDECGSEEMGAPARDLYEQKAVSKVVRVLTVLAYLLSVSLAAILLSIYYICVWKSPELPPIDDTIEVAARRAAPPHLYSYNGGSNTTVSGNLTQHINITDDGFWNANDTLDTGEAVISEELLDDVSEILRANSSHADGEFTPTGTIT